MPLRDMLSLSALGIGPGWLGKILPPSPPSSPLGAGGGGWGVEEGVCVFVCGGGGPTLFKDPF